MKLVQPLVQNITVPRRSTLPERSLALRRWVFVASLPPILAVAWTGALWGPALLAAVILAGGHYYSWRAAQHEKPNALVQLAVFIALHLVLAWMCAGFYVGAALPQAQFALYAQAVTSFDLRRRVNLFSSLGMSLLVLYVAATLSRDYSFVVFLLAFVALSLGVFFRAEIEDGLQGAKNRMQDTQSGASQGQRTGRYRTFFALYACLLLLASCLVFAFTPHYAGRPLIPPFSLNLPIPRGVTSQILNPAVPLVQINGWSNQKGDYYYGFDSQLDLRYRGGLSDQIVMYVLSPAWSYWRSHAYDTYNGHAWSQSQAAVTMMKRKDSLHFDIPADTQALGDEVVQSYYIARDQPNLVFAAYRPLEVYINSDELALDSGDGLRVGEPIKARTTYTVLSRRPNFSAEALRAASGDYPADIAARYLQLPGNISQRVRDLARQLTANAPTPYDKAAALRDYARTLKYDPFPPPQPPNSETVDNFLFVDRRGVCEQFATAHAVMLRTLGIPARLAAGYGAGEHNPLSGYYAVRASDAHAWTEVYFPGYGWVPFDPTPGWTPSPYTAPVQRWIFSSALDSLPSLPLGAAFATGAAFFGAAFGGLTILLVPVILVALACLLRFLLRRSQPSRFSTIDRDPNRLRILAAFRAGQRRLGLYRAPAETPHEFAQRIARDDWGELTAVVEGAAYRTTPPSPALAQRAWELLRRLPRRPLRDYVRQSVGTVKPRLPSILRLPKIIRPAPRARAVSRSGEMEGGRGCVLIVVTVTGLIGYAVSALVSILFNGGSVRLPLRTLCGPLPAIALVLAFGGGLIAWVCLRLARERWMLWVAMGSLGMAFFAAVATAAGEVAVVSIELMMPQYQWWKTPAEIVPSMISDVAFLLPLSVPTGLLIGFGLFGAAGWLWGRWLASRSHDS